MIKVKSELGIFIIKNGKFVEGSEVLKELFTIHTKSTIAVSEGDIDYAIAARMMIYQKWEILESNYKNSEKGVVY